MTLNVVLKRKFLLCLLQYKKYLFSFILLFNTLAFANLIRPDHGEELNSIHVFFEWEQQPDAMGYNLQASTRQSFNNIILDVDELTTVYIDKDNFSWDDNYHWRVRPIYNDGSSGSWTESSEFSIRETMLLGLDINIYNDALIEDDTVLIEEEDDIDPTLDVGVEIKPNDSEDKEDI